MHTGDLERLNAYQRHVGSCPAFGGIHMEMELVRLPSAPDAQVSDCDSVVTSEANHGHPAACVGSGELAGIHQVCPCQVRESPGDHHCHPWVVAHSVFDLGVSCHHGPCPAIPWQPCELQQPHGCCRRADQPGSAVNSMEKNPHRCEHHDHRNWTVGTANTLHNAAAQHLLQLARGTTGILPC